MLVAAGLVAQERRGRTRYCRLEREPLQQAGGWIANYADFWRGRLDSLAESDGGTRVSLVHSGIAAADQYERYEQGWQGFLANLKSVLEAAATTARAMGVRTLA